MNEHPPYSFGRVANSRNFSLLTVKEYDIEY
jgi:hypothetical protein